MAHPHLTAAASLGGYTSKMATALQSKGSVSRNGGSRLAMSARARAFLVGRGGARQTTRCLGMRRPVCMPVAVPKVPYRTPGDGTYQWIDLWNCLYRERIIFVGQALSDDLANQLVGTLLYLDSISDKDMQIYINSCEGGALVPSLSLFDTMRALRSDIATVGFGGAMGMAAFLLCAGTKGKRLSLAHTRIMMVRTIAPSHARFARPNSMDEGRLCTFARSSAPAFVSLPSLTS